MVMQYALILCSMYRCVFFQMNSHKRISTIHHLNEKNKYQLKFNAYIMANHIDGATPQHRTCKNNYRKCWL